MAAGLVVGTLGGGSLPVAAAREQYTLPPLGYAFDALEPYIDAITMQFHHDGHHGTYVRNLNTAFQNYPQLYDRAPEDLLRDLMSIPEEIRTTVRNSGGGHVNHTLFWEIMTPGSRSLPAAGTPFATAIADTFGSFDMMRTMVTMAASTRFGSGFAWVSVTPDRKLTVESTPNQDSPYMEGRTPVLGVDVWEHAYYLKYQDRRAEYLNAWWNTVNWSVVEGRWLAATR